MSCWGTGWLWDCTDHKAKQTDAAPTANLAPQVDTCISLGLSLRSFSVHPMAGSGGYFLCPQLRLRSLGANSQHFLRGLCRAMPVHLLLHAFGGKGRHVLRNCHLRSLWMCFPPGSIVGLPSHGACKSGTHVTYNLTPHVVLMGFPGYSCSTASTFLLAEGAGNPPLLSSFLLHQYHFLYICGCVFFFFIIICYKRLQRKKKCGFGLQAAHLNPLFLGTCAQGKWFV